jgi:hypothetical protein
LPIDDDELLYQRSVLAAAVTEITSVARWARLEGIDQTGYLLEALRVAEKLWKVQKEIEKRDID